MLSIESTCLNQSNLTEREVEVNYFLLSQSVETPFAQRVAGSEDGSHISLDCSRDHVISSGRASALILYCYTV